MTPSTGHDMYRCPTCERRVLRSHKADHLTEHQREYDEASRACIAAMDALARVEQTMPPGLDDAAFFALGDVKHAWQQLNLLRDVIRNRRPGGAATG